MPFCVATKPSLRRLREGAVDIENRLRRRAIKVLEEADLPRKSDAKIARRSPRSRVQDLGKALGILLLVLAVARASVSGQAGASQGEEASDTGE